jgi:predicted enzyme related to lactoylglutathione lyase
MIAMPKIVHLEIRADVPFRAAKFYSSVLGWNVKKKLLPQGEHFAMEDPGGASSSPKAGVMQRRNRDTFVPRFEVPSLDAAIGKVSQNGGKVVTHKRFLPGVGLVSYCHDTEGNAFSLLEKL